MSRTKQRESREKFGARLRLLRTAIDEKCSKAAFAKHLGLPESTYSDYEKGHAPSADFLAKVAGTLGCSGDWLLTGKGQPWPDDVACGLLVDGSFVRLETLSSEEAREALAKAGKLGRYIRGQLARKKPRPARELQVAETPGAYEAGDACPARAEAVVERRAEGVPDALRKEFGIVRVRPPRIMSLDDYYEGFVARGENLEGFVPLPVQRGRAGAGQATGLSLTAWAVAVVPAAMLPDPDRPGRYVVVRLKGASMSPALEDGAFVLVDREQRDPEQIDGRVVLCDTRRRSLVKCVKVTPGHFELHSINPLYAPIFVPRREKQNPALGVVVLVWYNGMAQPAPFCHDLSDRLDCAEWCPRQQSPEHETNPAPLPRGYHVVQDDSGTYIVPDDHPEWLEGSP